MPYMMIINIGPQSEPLKSSLGQKPSRSHFQAMAGLAWEQKTWETMDFQGIHLKDGCSVLMGESTTIEHTLPPIIWLNLPTASLRLLLTLWTRLLQSTVLNRKWVLTYQNKFTLWYRYMEPGLLTLKSNNDLRMPSFNIKLHKYQAELDEKSVLFFIFLRIKLLVE